MLQRNVLRTTKSKILLNKKYICLIFGIRTFYLGKTK